MHIEFLTSGENTSQLCSTKLPCTWSLFFPEHCQLWDSLRLNPRITILLTGISKNEKNQNRQTRYKHFFHRIKWHRNVLTFLYFLLLTQLRKLLSSFNFYWATVVLYCKCNLNNFYYHLLVRCCVWEFLELHFCWNTLRQSPPKHYLRVC